MTNHNKTYELKLNERELNIIVEIMRFSLDYCPVEGICPDLNVAASEIEVLMTRLENQLKA